MRLSGKVMRKHRLLTLLGSVFAVKDGKFREDTHLWRHQVSRKYASKKRRVMIDARVPALGSVLPLGER